MGHWAESRAIPGGETHALYGKRDARRYRGSCSMRPPITQADKMADKTISVL
jgi:hypothetical protein